MDLMDVERELRSKMPSPLPAGSPGTGVVIDAREFPRGSAPWLHLDVGTPIDIAEYFPAFPAIRRIHFPPGRYACSAELCSYPNQKDPQGRPAEPPYFLHWRLKELGVEVIGGSEAPAAASPPAERFCPYCGHKSGEPHAGDCVRHLEGTAARGRGRPRKAG
jgi:hypothetical protein